jgi:hypothetical protein
MIVSKSSYNFYGNTAPTNGIELSNLLQHPVRISGRLRKNCKSIHLPAAGRDILLGTLVGYRTHYDNAVRDDLEAKFKLELLFPESTLVTKERLLTATFGTLFLWGRENENNLSATTVDGYFSTFSVHSRADVIVEKETSEALIIKGKISVLQESTDAFVLCLTTSDSGKSGVRLVLVNS